MASRRNGSTSRCGLIDDDRSVTWESLVHGCYDVYLTSNCVMKDYRRRRIIAVLIPVLIR